jgi:hypothetical protein
MKRLLLLVLLSFVSLHSSEGSGGGGGGGGGKDDNYGDAAGRHFDNFDDDYLPQKQGRRGKKTDAICFCYVDEYGRVTTARVPANEITTAQALGRILKIRNTKALGFYFNEIQMEELFNRQTILAGDWVSFDELKACLEKMKNPSRLHDMIIPVGAGQILNGNAIFHPQDFSTVPGSFWDNSTDPNSSPDRPLGGNRVTFYFKDYDEQSRVIKAGGDWRPEQVIVHLNNIQNIASLKENIIKRYDNRLDHRTILMHQIGYHSNMIFTMRGEKFRTSDDLRKSSRSLYCFEITNPFKPIDVDNITPAMFPATIQSQDIENIIVAYLQQNYCYVYDSEYHYDTGLSLAKGIYQSICQKLNISINEKLFNSVYPNSNDLLGLIYGKLPKKFLEGLGLTREKSWEKHWQPKDDSFAQRIMNLFLEKDNVRRIELGLQKNLSDLIRLAHQYCLINNPDQDAFVAAETLLNDLLDQKLAENDSLPMKDVLYELLEQVGIMRDEKSKQARANYLQGLQDQETAARAERDAQRQRWARRHNRPVESYESDEDSVSDDDDVSMYESIASDSSDDDSDDEQLKN